MIKTTKEMKDKAFMDSMIKMMEKETKDRKSTIDDARNEFYKQRNDLFMNLMNKTTNEMNFNNKTRLYINIVEYILREIDITNINNSEISDIIEYTLKKLDYTNNFIEKFSDYDEYNNKIKEISLFILTNNIDELMEHIKKGDIK